MNTVFIAYCLALILGILITSGLALYAWRRRQVVAGAGIYAVVMIVTLYISLCFLGLAIGQQPDVIYLFARLRFLGLGSTPILLFMAIMRYLGYRRWSEPAYIGLLFIVPLAVQFFIWTDGQFHLFYRNWTYLKFTIFSVERPQYNIGFWVHIAYSYGLILASLNFLVLSIFRKSGPFRGQAVAMLISYLLILVFNIPSLLLFSATTFPNITPIGYIPSSIIFAIALFRYELLIITPIANDTVVANMFDGVIVTNPQHRIVGFNPAAENILGTKAEMAIGRTLSDIFPQYQGVLSSATLGIEISQTLQLRPNVNRFYDVKTAPIYRKSQTIMGHLIVLRDITEQKSAQERAIDLAAERQRMQILTEFVRNSSHDLLTPLTIMSTNVYLLRQPNTDEAKIRRLDVLDRNISRLITIIEDLNQMSLLDGGLNVNLAPLNLNRIEHYVPDSFRTRMSLMQHILIWQLAPQPVMIHADESLVVKAFKNLLHNAILYTPKGGHITVSTGYQGQDFACLKIVDDGVGIEATHLAQIFDRFYKVNQSRSGDGSGAGLGLAIVKKIVDVHNGKLEVTSTPGKGSIFSLYFPVEVMHPATESKGVKNQDTP